MKPEFKQMGEYSLNIPELADAFEQMWSKRRYNEIFFMIDTCQAASMYQKFYSPNILAVASSLVGQDSLSHHVDPAIGEKNQNMALFELAICPYL